jgi:drug/metabolite transporter (DMT)-like permease
MPTSALAFALGAAAFHALWNLLLARAPDVESATVVALIVAEVVFAPVTVVVWHVDSGAWPWIAGTGLLQLAYFALLATAYRKAPLSVVYPVARGGAPVLVLVVGVVALGQGTSWAQAGAVLLVVTGIFLVRGVRTAGPGAVGFGLAIAACIASYTLVDKRGVQYAGAIPYLELSMIVPTIVYAGAIVRVRGATAVRAAVGPATIVAGIATFVAYALVLAALQRASAASVAAVRETSVVVAAALASVVLKEKVGPLRLLGAVLVVAGVALLAR